MLRIFPGWLKEPKNMFYDLGAPRPYGPGHVLRGYRAGTAPPAEPLRPLAQEEIKKAGRIRLFSNIQKLS